MEYEVIKHHYDEENNQLIFYIRGGGESVRLNSELYLPTVQPRPGKIFRLMQSVFN